MFWPYPISGRTVARLFGLSICLSVILYLAARAVECMLVALC